LPPTQVERNIPSYSQRNTKTTEPQMCRIDKSPVVLGSRAPQGTPRAMPLLPCSLPQPIYNLIWFARWITAVLAATPAAGVLSQNVPLKQ
jgi:hypothetical protein